MKLTLNLSTTPSSHERYALAWAVPTAVIALAGLVLLSLLAVRNFREYRSVRRSVLESEQTEARLRTQEMALRRDLEQPQLRQVYRQAQFVNALIDQKQFSLTELTEKVSKLLPGDVRLTGLALSRAEKDRVVRFSVAGNDEEAVETFLSRLEDSADFADVAILNQGFGQEGAGHGPVIIACVARYVGGRAR
ncbi:MAG: hypothetical protein ABSA70_11895 [Terriglobia bacterium]